MPVDLAPDAERTIFGMLPTDAQKDEPIILAANALASVKVEDLPPQQHIELLEFLCDDVLGSEEMRSIIQSEDRCSSVPHFFLYTIFSIHSSWKVCSFKI